MEDSETQKQLLNLGKRLINNLDRSKGDRTSEWMTSYLAEKIIATESVQEDKITTEQRECFETILHLWEHRAHLPTHTRPFEDFEPVFRAIKHIDPENPAPSYFRNENSSQAIPKDVEQYVNLIVNLDSATRVMLSFYMKEAIMSTMSESTIEWLDAIKGIAESGEARIILNFLPEMDSLNGKQANDLKSKKIKQLTEQIEKLESFEHISKITRSNLQTQLDKIEKS
mgnify:CR=1 FL=1|jgi:hypothetical protein